jgi:RNA polymerase II C-terminal domain phosphatase-like 3/4
MERYHYFAASPRHFGFSDRPLSELMQDERESDGALATILDVLKRIHTIFFESVGYLRTRFPAALCSLLAVHVHK